MSSNHNKHGILNYLLLSDHFLSFFIAHAKQASDEILLWRSNVIFLLEINPLLLHKFLQHFLNSRAFSQAAVEACEGQVNGDWPHTSYHGLKTVQKSIPLFSSLQTKQKGADYVECKSLHQGQNLQVQVKNVTCMLTHVQFYFITII